MLEGHMLGVNNEDKKQEVLLMLSGGRDSFLSACRLISKDYKVRMITYDNGHMSKSELARETADRIIDRFGEDAAEFAGIYMIAQSIRPLMDKLLYSDLVTLCKDYPHLLVYQMNCLACHTAMYCHSIAYCVANEIHNIAEGAREKQCFFVELPEMKERYEKLCADYEINLHMPVYKLESDDERKRELADWGFLPKSFEPQCWLGCPMLSQLTKEQRESMLLYYDNEIESSAKKIIEQLISKKKIAPVELR